MSNSTRQHATRTKKKTNSHNTSCTSDEEEYLPFNQPKRGEKSKDYRRKVNNSRKRLQTNFPEQLRSSLLQAGLDTSFSDLISNKVASTVVAQLNHLPNGQQKDVSDIISYAIKIKSQSYTTNRLSLSENGRSIDSTNICNRPCEVKTIRPRMTAGTRRSKRLQGSQRMSLRNSTKSQRHSMSKKLALTLLHALQDSDISTTERSYVDALASVLTQKQHQGEVSQMESFKSVSAENRIKEIVNLESDQKTSPYNNYILSSSSNSSSDECALSDGISCHLASKKANAEETSSTLTDSQTETICRPFLSNDLHIVNCKDTGDLNDCKGNPTCEINNFTSKNNDIVDDAENTDAALKLCSSKNVRINRDVSDCKDCKPLCDAHASTILLSMREACLGYTAANKQTSTLPEVSIKSQSADSSAMSQHQEITTDIDLQTLDGFSQECTDASVLSLAQVVAQLQEQPIPARQANMVECVNPSFFSQCPTSSAAVAVNSQTDPPHKKTITTSTTVRKEDYESVTGNCSAIGGNHDSNNLSNIPYHHQLNRSSEQRQSDRLPEHLHFHLAKQPQVRIELDDTWMESLPDSLFDDATFHPCWNEECERLLESLKETVDDDKSSSSCCCVPCEDDTCKKPFHSTYQLSPMIPVENDNAGSHDVKFLEDDGNTTIPQVPYESSVTNIPSIFSSKNNFYRTVDNISCESVTAAAETDRAICFHEHSPDATIDTHLHGQQTKRSETFAIQTSLANSGLSSPGTTPKGTSHTSPSFRGLDMSSPLGVATSPYDPDGRLAASLCGEHTTLRPYQIMHNYQQVPATASPHPVVRHNVCVFSLLFLSPDGYSYV